MNMNDNFEKDLENSENWDFDKAEIREAPKSPRVIVSVAFHNDDFKIVSAYANRIGKKISEFIREAAVDKAIGKNSIISLSTFASSGTFWCASNLPSSTRLQTYEVERPNVDTVTTY
jgi:hypothetical protein